MRKLLLPTLGLILGLAAPAAAGERSLTEVARLAESAAAGDADALESLRATTSVDGTPVSLGAALGGQSDDETANRVLALSRLLAVQQAKTVEGDTLQDAVGAVLAQPKFQTRPESLWDRFVAWLTSWLVSAIGNVISLLGGPLIAGLVALALLAVIVGLSTARIARRRAARIDQRLDLERLIEEGADPAGLEREAAEAAARGDFTIAVRSRFVAGILRLHTTGRIRYTRGLTTGQIADQLQSDTFAGLAATFDEIAYGNRPGTRLDYEQSVDGWRRILADRPVAAGGGAGS